MRGKHCRAIYSRSIKGSVDGYNPSMVTAPAIRGVILSGDVRFLSLHI